MKKFEIGIFIIILVCAILLRFPLVIQGFFAFTYDQGRDLLEVQKLVGEHDPILIGPTTGLPGIFYGPWWYYFLGPIFLISGGNPTVITAIFGAIGILTIFLLYLLIKKITANVPVSLAVAAVAAMSQPFITSSSQIWSPSLVLPLMISYVFFLALIFEKPQPWKFLALGITSGLVMDSGAAFGVVLTIATIISGIFFKKYFWGKNYLFYFLGFLIILSPRIIFDIRNEFLITKSIIQEIQNPHIYQQKLAFVERLINRADLFLLNFAQTFSQSRKILSFLPLVFIIFTILKFWPQFKKNNVFRIILFIISIIYLLFVIYPDAVWGYYLVGLPVLFMAIFAIAASSLTNPKMLLVIIAVVVLLNFNFKISPPICDYLAGGWGDLAESEDGA